jgi:hypothetical protein
MGDRAFDDDDDDCATGPSTTIRFAPRAGD